MFIFLFAPSPALHPVIPFLSFYTLLPHLVCKSYTYSVASSEKAPLHLWPYLLYNLCLPPPGSGPRCSTHCQPFSESPVCTLHVQTSVQMGQLLVICSSPQLDKGLCEEGSGLGLLCAAPSVLGGQNRFADGKDNLWKR